MKFRVPFRIALFGLAFAALLLVVNPLLAESKLRWTKQLPVRQTKWRFVRDMQVDNTYRPTAAGDLVFVGCEHNGALLALDAQTGAERWRFYTGGAIRTQPAAGNERVLVGSDDGYMYCLSHEGELKWKALVGQGERFVIGHQRFMSAWPVPTHPLLADGKLFVLGGCWPADGVFMNAFDAETGELLWRSPSVHLRAMMIPHWIEDGQVYVRTYSGTGGKALRFDTETGAMSFWPKGTQTPPLLRYEVPDAANVAGSNGSGDLRFASGKTGVLYCAGPALKDDVRHWDYPAQKAKQGSTSAKVISELIGQSQGYALVTNLTDGKLIEGLLADTDFYVVAVDSDETKVNRIRRQLDDAGCFDSHRLTVLAAELKGDVLPPYFANLVTTESGDKPSDIALQSLRPYSGFAIWKIGDKWKLKSRGELVGGGNWSHEYANTYMNNSTADRIVKAPLGVLWYGGEASDRKYYLSGNRPAGALVVNGRMFLQGKGVVAAVDIYNGRLLWEADIPKMHIYNGTHGGGGGGLKDSQPWEDEKAAAVGVPPIKHARATGFNWAASGDCIYLFAAEKCLRFDSATGEPLPAFEMPLPAQNSETLCWGCPRIVGDVLVATAFRPSDLRDARIGIGGNGGDWTGDRMPMSHLLACDRTTGKLLWSQSAKHGFNNRAFVVTNNRVICSDLLQTDAAQGFIEAGRKASANHAAIRAFDLATGKEAWSHPTKLLIKYLSYDPATDTLYAPNRYGRTWTETGWGWPGLSERETRSKSGRPNGVFRAFEATGGKLRWEISEQHYDGPFTMIGGRLLNRYGTGFDPKTGKLDTRLSPITGLEESYGFHKQGCAVLGGCDSLVAWRTAYHDIETRTSTQLAGFEAGCTTSLLPAGGVLNLPNFGMFHLRARTAAVTMAHRPSSQPWTDFQFTKLKAETPIERIGYNFGSPGDRFNEQGELWIQAKQGGDWKINIEPKNEVEWFASGVADDWIGQSRVEGASKISLPTAMNQRSNSKAKSRYNVTLIFPASRPGAKPPVISISIEGEKVLTEFTAGSEKGSLKRVFENVEVTGMLEIELTAHTGKTALAGVEIRAVDSKQ